MSWIDPQRPAATLIRRRHRRGRWLALFAVLALAAALLAAGGYALLYPRVAPGPAPEAPEAPGQTSAPSPTAVPATAAPTAVRADVAPPLLSAEARVALLAAPLVGEADRLPVAVSLPRAPLLPFTTIPERPRNTVIEHEVREGETLESIAALYGLQVETLAWSNNYRYIQVIKPEDRVIILPVDGVYHKALGNQTIGELAERYGVAAADILNSPYNRLASGTTAETPLPSNLRLVVPGGVGEAIVWKPTVVLGAGVAAGAGQSGSTIAFYGGSGTCGSVVNPGGGAAWVAPMAAGSYTVTRGFSLIHAGIDLASYPGAPVRAANSGRVIFAGWNVNGYGYLIVLAHGPFLTLYAHLSQINVRCHQDVSGGQIIGGVGNTGNSSGPHLHFEIRYGPDSPQDPAYTIGF